MRLKLKQNQDDETECRIICFRQKAMEAVSILRAKVGFLNLYRLGLGRAGPVNSSSGVVKPGPNMHRNILQYKIHTHTTEKEGINQTRKISFCGLKIDWQGNWLTLSDLD